MSRNENTIECPECGAIIDIDKISYREIEEELKEKFAQNLAQEKKKLKGTKEKLEKDRKAMEEREEQFEGKLEDALAQEKKKLKGTKEKLEKERKAMEEREEQFEGELEDALAQEKKKLKGTKEKLEKERKAMEEREEQFEEKFEDALAKKLDVEKKKAQAAIKKQLQEEQEDQIKILQESLDEKSKQVRELNKTKAEIETLKRDKEELRDKIELESQKKLNLQLAEEKKKIRTAVESENELRLLEKEEKIKQIQDQLKIAQQKADQGSMQTQGEVQELAIEKWLGDHFPQDTIEEIKKGQRGADCLQRVRVNGCDCGSIYYESKRTKAFQAGWIEKFKQDIQEKGADIGVLVTEAMPKDMDRMGLRDGVWVCSFDEFKGLSLALRQSVIQVSKAIVTQENKGDKMGMLYDYLTGKEFRDRIEAIVAGFTDMKIDLEGEKRAYQKQWKKREKQIEKVLLNTTQMYGSIEGIAGTAIQPMPLMELPGNAESYLLDEG
jgi:hypothetical protein